MEIGLGEGPEKSPLVYCEAPGCKQMPQALSIQEALLQESQGRQQSFLRPIVLILRGQQEDERVLVWCPTLPSPTQVGQITPAPYKEAQRSCLEATTGH